MSACSIDRRKPESATQSRSRSARSACHGDGPTRLHDDGNSESFGAGITDPSGGDNRLGIGVRKSGTGQWGGQSQPVQTRSTDRGQPLNRLRKVGRLSTLSFRFHGTRSLGMPLWLLRGRRVGGASASMPPPTECGFEGSVPLTGGGCSSLGGSGLHCPGWGGHTHRVRRAAELSVFRRLRRPRSPQGQVWSPGRSRPRVCRGARHAPKIRQLQPLSRDRLVAHGCTLYRHGRASRVGRPAFGRG